MERLSGLRGSDRVKLITELYKVYSRVHDESFDTFYFWGDMLLADFDQIDKYLIDADMLFSNIGDLKALEGDHSYLTDDQIRVIRQFWQSFGSGSSCSDEQRHFLTIWESLADIYHRFRESLSAQGLAYEGMVYRRLPRDCSTTKRSPCPAMRTAVMSWSDSMRCRPVRNDCSTD